MRQDIIDYKAWEAARGTPSGNALAYIVKCNARRRLYQRARPNHKGMPPETSIEMPSVCPLTSLELNFNPLEDMSWRAPVWALNPLTGRHEVISRLARLKDEDTKADIYSELTRVGMWRLPNNKPSRAEVIEVLGKGRAILVKSQHYLAGLT